MFYLETIFLKASPQQDEVLVMVTVRPNALHEVEEVPEEHEESEEEGVYEEEEVVEAMGEE